MSYILDALRKSDAQRRRGATPPLLAPLTESAAPARSRTVAYGLVAAALLAAGLVIGSLRPWQTEPPAAVTAAAPAKLPESPPKPTATASTPAPAAQIAAPPAPDAPKRQSPQAARSAAKARAAQPPRPVVAAVPKDVAKPAADAPREQKLPAFSELPVPIQQEIPSLSISAHAYSPVARERLVGINDRVLREGAEAAPGLVLEQITPEGMIMSYKGYRFRRGVR